MGDTNDQHDERILLYFVEYAIIADAEPSQAAQLSLQCAAQERVLR